MKKRLISCVMKKLFRFIFWIIPLLDKDKLLRHDTEAPQVAWKSGDWELCEVRSPFTDLRHRYYHHRSEKSSAPVFLFLHGLFLDGRNFLGFDSLADEWNLIAYEFPDDSPAYKGEMSDFSAMICDFLNTLNHDRVYLCGVSFGGGIALQFALENSGRILGMVMISTFVMTAFPRYMENLKTLEDVVVGQSDFRIRLVLDRFLSRSLRYQGLTEAEINDLFRLRKCDWYRQVLKAMTNIRIEPDVSMCFPFPVLALHGDADRVIPLSQAVSIPRCIQQTAFRIIHGATHAMSCQKSDEIARIIRNYLKNDC